MSTKNTPQKGFALIEVIIYIALYGIMIGGVVVSAYAMFETSSTNKTKVMVEEEGSYLLEKIGWALIGATEVDSHTTTMLAIERDGDPPSIAFTYADNSLSLSGDGITEQMLNGTGTDITNVAFTHVQENGDGIRPERVTVSFTLTAISPTGVPYSQDFFMTEYIKK